MSQSAHHLENGSASPSENGTGHLAAADAAKTEANAHFKDHKFTEAVDGYTKAIELNPNNAVYYANRAAAHIHLENFGCALTDASRAIEIDPKYTKGIYRRADANWGLGRMKKALTDYKRAAQVNARDPDLRKKLTQCEKEVKRIRFEEAVATPDEKPAAEDMDLSSMPVEDGYDGPMMEGEEEQPTASVRRQ